MIIDTGFPEKQAEVLVNTFVSRGFDKVSFVYLIFVAIILLISIVVLIRSLWK